MSEAISLAVEYDEKSDIQYQDGLKLLSFVQLQDGMKVLDLGCGTGQLARVIADKVGEAGHVVGIDPDKARIRIAEEKYGSIKNVSFKIGSAQEIPGSPGSYDVVFSNYVFHWIEDKEQAFKNVLQCLKPSGVFAVCCTTGILEFPTNYINLLEPNQLSKFKRHLFYETADDVERMAISCGFSVQHKVETNRVARFKNFDEFIRCTYVGFNGIVDPDLMDGNKLAELKRSMGNKEVEFSLMSVAVFTFKKAM